MAPSSGSVFERIAAASDAESEETTTVAAVAEELGDDRSTVTRNLDDLGLLQRPKLNREDGGDLDVYHSIDLNRMRRGTLVDFYVWAGERGRSSTRPTRRNGRPSSTTRSRDCRTSAGSRWGGGARLSRRRSRRAAAVAAGRPAPAGA